MPLPAGVTTFTLTFGAYTDGQGSAALVGTAGKLFPVDPSTNRRVKVLHPASGAVIVPADIPVTVLDDGTATVAGIPHTGQASLSPSGWAWRMEWALPTNNPSHPGNKTFVVVSGATVDYDQLAAAETVPAVAISLPNVTSVAGLTGAPTSAQLVTALGTDLDAAYATDAALTTGLAAKQDIATFDAAMTAEISDPASAASVALRAAFVEKTKVPVNAADYPDLRTAAEAAFTASRPLYVPAGSYAFTGASLDPGNSFSIIGERGTVITLPVGGYMIETAANIPNVVTTNVRFSGGAGAYKFTRTGSNVTNSHVYRNVEFRSYTQCAVSYESSDLPYIRFTNCQFQAASYDGTIGVALPSRAAGSVFDSCDFNLNRIDLKVRDGAPNVYVRNCGFVRSAGTVTATRARIWVVPTSFPTAGAGMVVTGCKFGNENQVAGDLQIIYADEGAGDFNGAKMPVLDAASTGTVSWHVYRDNNISLGWSGSGSSPVVFSTTPNVQYSIFAPNIYQNDPPTALVEYLPATGLANIPVPLQTYSVGRSGVRTGLQQAVTTADRTLPTSSTTLVNDPELAVPVERDRVYRIEGMVIYDGPTTADLSVGTYQPTGTLIDFSVDGLISTATTSSGSVNRGNKRLTTDFTTIGALGVGTTTVAYVRGYMTVGTTSGTFGLRFAQGTSDAGNVTIFSRSRLVVTPVG